MTETALLLLMAVLVGATGVLTVRGLAPGARWTPAIVFAAFALGILIVGWLALLLAEFGLFGLGALVLVVVAWMSAMGLWRRFSARRVEPIGVRTGEEQLAVWEWVLLAGWLVVALWLFLRPHEYVYGGADAGVYVSLGAEIARQGGFRVVDGTLAEMTPEMRAAVLRSLPNTPGASSYLLPGFYVTDADTGRITPQFYPLHPVWQAVVFAAAGDSLAGIRIELLLTGVWMLLGTLAVYWAARDAGGPVVAALSLAALSLNALQVWFGRYPTSEALTQFLFWLGIWCGGRWLGERNPARLWAFVAGVAFGSVFLVRIDTLVLLPVFALVLLWRWASGWYRADTWFAVPFVALVVHSLLHGHFFSGPYFYETVGYGVFLLSRLWLLAVMGIVAGLIVLWWLARHPGRLRAPEHWRRPILGALVVILLMYGAYGWFLRPALSVASLRPDFFSGGEVPVTNHENWLRLGWYVTPLGIWLGILGGCLLVWRVERRMLLLVTIGWLFTAIYLWNVSANPHHVYVMRRYVPIVMPFLTLNAAYLLGQGWRWVRDGRSARPAWVQRARPALATALVFAVVAWAAGIGWAARGFVSRVDHAGLAAQLDELAGRLPPGAVLLFNDQAAVGQGDVWGTPLRFIYGFDAYALRRSPVDATPVLVESIETWQNNGRPVVWVGDAGWLAQQGFAYRTERLVLSSDRLESSYDHKPQTVLTETVELALNYLEPETNGAE